MYQRNVNRGPSGCEKDFICILMQNCVHDEYIKDILRIDETMLDDRVWKMMIAFGYGVIIGKREERARRKGAKA